MFENWQPLSGQFFIRMPGKDPVCVLAGFVILPEDVAQNDCMMRASWSAKEGLFLDHGLRLPLTSANYYRTGGWVNQIRETQLGEFARLPLWQTEVDLIQHTIRFPLLVRETGLSLDPTAAHKKTWLALAVVRQEFDVRPDWNNEEFIEVFAGKTVWRTDWTDVMRGRALNQAWLYPGWGPDRNLAVRGTLHQDVLRVMEHIDMLDLNEDVSPQAQSTRNLLPWYGRSRDADYLMFRREFLRRLGVIRHTGVVTGDALDEEDRIAQSIVSGMEEFISEHGRH